MQNAGVKNEEACYGRRENMDIAQLKHQQLRQVARHRENLKIRPHLRWLFFEITSRCNLLCKHCGSRCTSKGDSLSVGDVEKTLMSLRSEHPMICLTGGEPVMHSDFLKLPNVFILWDFPGE